MSDAAGESSESRARQIFQEAFNRYVSEGLDPNSAAAKAVEVLAAAAASSPSPTSLLSPSTPGNTQVAPESTASTTAAPSESEGNQTTEPSEKETVANASADMHIDPDYTAYEETQQMETEAFPPPAPPTRTTLISAKEVMEIHAECIATGSYTKLIQTIGKGFSDPASVADSFADSDNAPKLSEARAVFELIGEIDEPPGVQNSLRNALTALASQMEFPFTSSYEKRIIPFLVCLEYDAFSYDPDLVSVVSSLFRVVARMPEESKKLLEDQWLGMDEEYLNRVLGIVQMFITLKVSMGGKHVVDFNYVREGVIVLDILHRVNQVRNFAPYSDFYNSAINELATEYDGLIREDLAMWFQAHEDAQESGVSPLKESFCDYGFIFDAGSKARVLQLEAKVQQQTHATDSLRAQLREGGFFQRPSPYFVVRVRRDEIVNDVLDIVAQSSSQDFKKPLRVQFQGEAGVDEGGVKKEFFLLLVRKLLDPQYSMFQMDEESRKLWFNPNTFEMTLKFELCGILIGLAIYNGVILDVHFPVALYRKLLGRKPTLSDVKDFTPRTGKSLEQLLALPADEVESLGLTFQISSEVFGEIQSVDLKPGGAEIEVTAENRGEYVNLYVDHLFNKSVEKIYHPFQKGFHMVCGGTFLSMFHPEEMELLLCGSPDLDFTALENSCRYEDGFTENSPTVKMFWSVVHEMDDVQKKKFLMFATGSDRVPIRGLAALRLTISKNGEDSERLPVAHTCFNHLLLPEYQTRERLQNRLLLAIEHSEGFGTM